MPVPYLGTALMRKQSTWTVSRSKQSVTASGSPPSSFVVCQSQLAGMKQTGQLHALHQLIRLTRQCDLSKHICQLMSTVSHHIIPLFIGSGTEKSFF